MCACVYLRLYVSMCVLACVLSLHACVCVCVLMLTRRMYVWSSKRVGERVWCVHACKYVCMCACVCRAVCVGMGSVLVLICMPYLVILFLCVGIESILVPLHAVCRYPLFLSLLLPESFLCVCVKARAQIPETNKLTHIPHGLDAS